MAATRKSTAEDRRPTRRPRPRRRPRRSTPTPPPRPAQGRDHGRRQGGQARPVKHPKSQLLAAEYKKAGGGYTKGKAEETGAQKSLEAWTDQKWTTADGTPAVRDGETARYLPEKAWDELTPAQKKATDAKKKAGSKKGKQFVANTEAAKKARKKASS